MKDGNRYPNRLRELRLSHPEVLTQRDLARRAGVSYQHLCRLEAGSHRPRPTTAERLARVLGVRREEVFPS